MLKSHVTELMHAYASLFQDIAAAYPATQKDCERDLKHLASVVSVSGIYVLTVDLPAAGKHFDKCLTEGRYVKSRLVLTSASPRKLCVPAFLRGLFYRVFDDRGYLKEEYDAEAIFFIRQVYYLAKKASIMCADEHILDSVKELVVTDSALPVPERFWLSNQMTEEYCEEVSFNDPLYSSRPFEGEIPLSLLLNNLERISGLVTSALGPYRYEEWSFRHGPGAVAERKGPGNKYRFTCWPDLLDSEFPFSDVACYNHTDWAARYYWMERMGSNPRPSRLIAVKKTYLKPRLIAAEPSEHQWCQQNLWHYFCDRSSKTWIGSMIQFRDQTRNQELALRGSIDGALATIDLSEASDRVSCAFVGRFFRKNIRLLAALRASRTPCLVQHINPEVCELVELRKFSTMGSACTFPVESLIFLSVVLSACLAQRGLPPTLEAIAQVSCDIGVFGDDLVVPVDCREVVCRFLEVLDFKVNTAKTFGSGKFRESCGVDAFGGHNITPVYWRTPTSADPESLLSKIDTINNFTSRGLFNVASMLRSTVHRRVKFPYVSWTSGVVGYKSHLGENLSGFKTRWNSHLFRIEVLVPRVSIRAKRRVINDNSVLLQFFTEDPGPYTPWRGGYTLKTYSRVVMSWVPVAELGPKPIS